jgi:hypothetical protein
MKLTMGKCRMIIQRMLSVVGVVAAGTGLVSLASSQVFAHQFLQDMTPGPNVGMVYSPELQVMVKPGTNEPVYNNSSAKPGSFKLVATSAVTQGSGPYGQGPHHDDD